MKKCCKETDLAVRKEFLIALESLFKLEPNQAHQLMGIVIQTTKDFIKYRKETSKKAGGR